MFEFDIDTSEVDFGVPKSSRKHPTLCDKFVVFLWGFFLLLATSTTNRAVLIYTKWEYWSLTSASAVNITISECQHPYQHGWLIMRWAVWGFRGNTEWTSSTNTFSERGLSNRLSTGSGQCSIFKVTISSGTCCWSSDRWNIFQLSYSMIPQPLSLWQSCWPGGELAWGENEAQFPYRCVSTKLNKVMLTTIRV